MDSKTSARGTTLEMNLPTHYQVTKKIKGLCGNALVYNIHMWSVLCECMSAWSIQIVSPLSLGSSEYQFDATSFFRKIKYRCLVFNRFFPALFKIFERWYSNLVDCWYRTHRRILFRGCDSPWAILVLRIYISFRVQARTHCWVSMQTTFSYALITFKCRVTHSSKVAWCSTNVWHSTKLTLSDSY